MEVILEQIILITKIGVGVYISSVAAEHEHRRAVDHCGVMVARRGRRAGRERPAPGLLLHVEAQQVVQHPLAVVAAEDVNRVLVRDDGVLAATAGQNKGGDQSGRGRALGLSERNPSECKGSR